ncbi:glycosyltransferase family 10 [Brachyspira intermedia]|uniref:glycosyltransferase family 10 domain-containing protein n=1 Tax=Brachyspira intermedia TaxID=84377 RepID=UPI0030053FAB
MSENKKFIDKILWFVPIKKLRHFLRAIFYNILDLNELKDIKSELYDLRNEIRYINKSKNKVLFMKETNYFKDITKGSESAFFLILKLILEKYDINLLYSIYNPDIELFHAYGSSDKILTSKSKIKIFFTMEAVKRFGDYPIDYTDLCLGFNYIDSEKYIRLPLWMYANFCISEINKDNIYKKIIDINNIKFKKTKFASLISTWGGIGNLRKVIYKRLEKIDKVYCPSAFMHNDDTLKNDFADDKLEYLKQFKFNICPENCIEDGYITEKLFDAFNAGCVPIWNGYKNLEGDVINKNAVLYWEENSDNEDIIKEIYNMHKNDDLYDKFVSQPRFNVDNATDYIYSQIKLLHEKIEELLCKKFNL